MGPRRQTPVDSISAACRAWDEVCREVDALTRAMGALDCTTHVGRRDGPQVFDSGQECWKAYEWPTDRSPGKNWCESCRRRQQLYLQRLDMARRRGARLRVLRRLIRMTQTRA